MAQNGVEITLNTTVYTELTNSDVSHMTFIVKSGEAEVRTSGDSTAPSVSLGGATVGKGAGLAGEPISKVMPSTQSPTRVWAKAATDDATVIWVDHA